MRIQHFNRQRGDTIVEVLIAIAVVSLILGGAYIATNRSLLATRAAQERGNALKLAEAQIEQIKGLAATNSVALFGSGAPSSFCISKANGQVFPASSTVCKVGLTGDPTDVDPRFTISVTRSGYNFTLVETWTDVSGRTVDRLEMRYRVYD